MSTIKNQVIEAHFLISLTNPRLILSVTDCVHALLGFKADDFLTGKLTLQSCIHPHDYDIATVLFSTEMAPLSGTFNIRLRHADGRIRCIKGHYAKAESPTGNGITLEILLQDAKSLWKQDGDQSMIANFKAMMENTDDFIYFKDSNHVFTGASETLVAVTDPSEHWTDLIGQTDYDVFPEHFADIYYSLEKQVFAGIPIAHEVQETLDRNGNKGWVDNRKYPIKNDTGEITGLFGIARDITDNKRIESLLKENEERFALATSHNGIGIWDLNLHTQELVVDDLILTFYNRKREEFNNTVDTWMEWLHPDDLVSCYQNIQAAISGRIPFNDEFRTIWSNGEIRYIQARAKIFYDANGSPLRMIGTNIDITEQKQAEEALKIAAIVFESKEGMLVTDANTIILRVNHAFTKITGYSAKEAIGKTPSFLKSGQHDEAFYTSMWESINCEGYWEGKIWNRRKNGEVYPEKLTITSVKNASGGVTNYVVTINDFSRQEQVENALKDSEFRWKFAIEGAGDGVWDWNIRTDEAHYSKRWKEMLGYGDADILPTNVEWSRRVHPDDQLYVKNAMQAYLEGKTKIYVVEYRLRCKDDSYKWILGRGMIVSRSEDGKPLRMIGTHTDISERKCLEVELTRQAHLDYLTGLSNRRHFMEQCEVELSRAIRYDTPISILMLDIDFFKKVNDTYGHQVGDIVLQALCKICQETLRQVDVAGRLGGEEFAIILPEADSQEAFEVAERLREVIANMEVTIPTGLPIHFTISIGVTTLHDKNVNIDMLLNQADKALYEAKETGRNKVCVC